MPRMQPKIILIYEEPETCGLLSGEMTSRGDHLEVTQSWGRSREGFTANIAIAFNGIKENMLAMNKTIRNLSREIETG